MAYIKSDSSVTETAVYLLNPIVVPPKVHG